MAIGTRRQPKKPLEQDPLVERLVEDPAAMQGFKVLVGLVGRSSRAGYWRVYVNAYLSEYFEFRAADVCHHEPVERVASPLGGSVIWLKATAEILRASSTPAAIAQEFLAGEISGALLAAAVAPAAGLATLRPWLAAVNTWVCTNRTAGTCTLVVCTRVEECRISREANPCV